MGVTGLWNLIEDAGTRVKVETLQGKVLAIDLSIWINQSVKGFRDKSGRQVENAHILGLFYRICKLLFYGIKPIFVFDGPCPALKRNTIQKRHERTSKALQKSRQQSLSVLERYINSQFDLALDATSRSKLRLASKSFQAEFLLPPSIPRQVDIYQDIVRLNEECKNRLSDHGSSSEESDSEPTGKIVDDGGSFHHSSLQNLYDVDINSDSFKSLPPITRYEILVEMRESYKGRKNTCPELLPEEADTFSKYQMQKLLKKRNLQEEIDRLIDELHGGEANLEFWKNSQKVDPKFLEETNKLTGRLASDEKTRYLLIKTSKSQLPSDQTLSKSNLQEVVSNEDSNSQNVAYTLPNRLPGQESDDGEDRIEVLARTSGSSQSFPSKKVAKHFDQNYKKFSGKVTNPKLSESSSSEDDDDFVEVSMSEDEQEDLAMFDEASNLPYPTNYAMDIFMEKSSIVSTSNANIEINQQDIASTSQVSINHSDVVEIDSKETDKKPVDVVCDNDILETIEVVSEKNSSEVNSEVLTTTIEELPEPTIEPLIMESTESSVMLEDGKNQETKTVTLDSDEVNEPKSVSEPIDLEKLKRDSEESAKLSRQAASVTTQMVAECKELLQLFGVPWVVAPAEAEAQCAQLEQTGLCHGVITDDSDIFLFGGRNVYRHFFTNSKYIMRYQVNDLEKYYGLTRSKLICLGMLSGTDYTLGIDGVGPVTSLEILSEFPGENLEPLVCFAKWYREKVFASKNSTPENSRRAKLLKLLVPESFPSRVIFEAYLKANVDHSMDPFSWSSPKLHELRLFAGQRFGWSTSKIDSIILPVLKKINEKEVQTRIDLYFPSSSTKNVPERLQIKRSKRLNEAIRKNLKRTSGQKSSISEKKSTTKSKKKCKKSKSDCQLVLSEDSSSDE